MQETPVRQIRVSQQNSEFDQTGILYKRRGGWAKSRNDFQPRVFTLSGNCFRYYTASSLDDVNFGEVRGELTIERSTLITFGQAIEGAPNKFTFILKNAEDEKWKLYASSESHFEEWVQAFRSLSRSFTPSPSSSLSSPSAPPSNFLRRNKYEGKEEEEEERKGGSNNNNMPSSNPSLRHSSSTTVKKRKPKQGPPPKKKTPWYFQPDNVELMVVMTLLNLCLFLVVYYPYPSSGTPTADTLLSHITTPLALLLANLLVFRTVFFRLRRPVISAYPHEIPPDMFEDDASMKGGLPGGNPSDGSSSSSKDAVLGDNYVEINGEAFPVAGCTMERYDGQNESKGHRWSDGNASLFNLRIGPDYGRNKKKAPSAESLFECTAVDFIKTDYKIDNLGSEMALPDVDGYETFDEHVPSLFLINVQFPTEPPGWTAVDDGPGIQVVFYYRIRHDVRKQLAVLNGRSMPRIDGGEGEEDLSGVEVHPSVRLFKEYCKQALDDPAFRSRFKMIAYVENMADLGFPSFITSYNAKPALIRKTGTLIQGAGNKYIEMDINVHRFASLPRKALTIMMTRFVDMKMFLGFVIEGRSNDELPETLFGSAYLHRPDPDKSTPLFDQA